MIRRQTCHLLALAIFSSCFAWAQGNSEKGRLRALNADVLRLRGLLYSASPAEQAQVRSQAAPLIEQRQNLLEALMASQPRAALQLAFPGDVLAGWADNSMNETGFRLQRCKVSGTKA